MIKHVNNGDCPKCDSILLTHGGTHNTLVTWFKSIQRAYPDAHVSCGGRGKKDQEDAFKRGASKAHFGESAHNFVPSYAIDIFKLHANGAEWPMDWFNTVVWPAVKLHNTAVGQTMWLEWYGEPGHKYPERPHVQIAQWKKKFPDRRLIV